MSTAKEDVQRMIAELPDEVSYEDIQYHIYVRQKIDRGLLDMREGRVLSREAVQERRAKWLEG